MLARGRVKASDLAVGLQPHDDILVVITEATPKNVDAPRVLSLRFDSDAKPDGPVIFQIQIDQ